LVGLKRNKFSTPSYFAPGDIKPGSPYQSNGGIKIQVLIFLNFTNFRFPKPHRFRKPRRFKVS